jgi:competence protein ComEC
LTYRIRLGIWLAVLCVLVTGCMQYERAQPSIIPMPENHFEGLQLSGNMTIEFIGLEAGEATLVRIKDGPTILIDTGHPTSQETLIDFLRLNGVTDVQYLILTHFSDEYSGNASVVLNEINVEAIIVSQLMKPYIIPPHWAFKGETIEVNPGETFKLSQELELHFLSPKRHYLSPQDNSLVFLLKHKGITALFTSGINIEVEKELTERYNLTSKILKVSDFGSNQASYEPFIEEVDAQVAVVFQSAIPVGTPEEVLERLHETWADVYQINTENILSTIKLISNGENYEIIEQEKDSPAE